MWSLLIRRLGKDIAGISCETQELAIEYRESMLAEEVRMQNLSANTQRLARYKPILWTAIVRETASVVVLPSKKRLAA